MKGGRGDLRSLLGKPREKKPQGNLRIRWEDYVRIDI